MARKRLYGATQKRRKKKQTQALKRQSSVTRVQSTHLPAPFQRAGEVSPQDVAFMEAMRDMGVERFPRAGEAPIRQEKFESVHIAAAREDEDSFLASMENLGVRPMTEKHGGRPSRPATAQLLQRNPAPPEGDTAPREGNTASPEENPVSVAARGNVSLLGGRARNQQERDQEKDTEPRGRGKAPPHASVGPSGIAGQAGTGGGIKPAKKETSQRARAATTFELGEHDAEMMAEALREGDFDHKAKFEGAPAPAPRSSAPPRREDSEREPDAELDLHGKTQEAAIRMVQNFLLTSYHRKLRHVLIITGKGLNSGAAGPVLREAVFQWMQRNGERFARSFAWAPARHGGEGAIWVVLR